MNNRFGNDRERHGDFGPFNRNERSGPRRHEDDERSGWGRGEEGEGSGWGERYSAQSREPQFSSDYDETYGSEWQRGGDQPHGAFQQGRGPGQGSLRQRGQGSYGQGSQGQGSFGQRDESRRGWYARSHAGNYGGGSGGGYQGGHGGGGYGGSSGTDYSGESQRFGGQGSYGGSQGSYGGSFGAGSFGGSQGSLGGSFGAGGYGSGGSWGRSVGEDFRSRDVGSPIGNLRSGQRGAFAGRGPKGYTRTDERIREDVCDRLSMDDDVDASEVEVRVKDGEVTLEGSVQTRSMKHQAEDLVEGIPGVKDVHNKLRVLKGFLNELKDKVSGNEDHGHYANTGTKGTAGTGTGQIANGRV